MPESKDGCELIKEELLAATGKTDHPNKWGTPVDFYCSGSSFTLSAMSPDTYKMMKIL